MRNVRPSRTAALWLTALSLLGAACANSPAAPVAEATTVAEAAAVPEVTGTPSAEADPVATASVEAAVAIFLESPSSANSALAVAAMRESGSEQWVPWLIDLLRLNVSSRVSEEIGETLAEITGIPSDERIPNMIAYGSWSSTRQLDGGPGYRAYKVALYERIDAQFGPLLESVVDQTELAAIQWGGVPVGGIPELNNPERAPASQAEWMVDDEVVLGVIENGEAVAYPLRIMARHELANDVVGGEPVSIVYCTLCRSAIVFESDVEGRTLQFLTSGLLSNSNKIMLDVETNTLWSHLRGTGIGGELVDVELTRRSVNHMRWSDWIAEYPTSEVLRLPQPIFFDDPERPPIAYDYTPGEAYASYYDNPDVWFPIIDTPDTFALKDEVVGIEVDGDSLAVPVAALNESGVALEAEVGGESFRFEPTGVGVLVLDAQGERVISEQSFWFAWFANHPETRTLIP